MEFPAKLFDSQHVPKAKHSINHCATFSTLPAVEEAVGPEVWQHVCNSPLGIIIKFSKLNFDLSSRLVRHVIINQLVCHKPFEIWSLLCGKPARFSLYEFEEITQLKCHEIPQDQPDVDETEMNRFWSLLKLRQRRNSPCIEDLEKLLDDCKSWSREDKIRFCYLVIMCNGFLGVDRREALPLQYARQVVDLDRFNKYPWGRVSFFGLIASVKTIDYTKLQQTSFTLKGFVQVLQIWLYVAVPQVVSNLGLSTTSDSSPLLRYNRKVGKLPLKEVFFGTNMRVRHMAKLKDRQMHPAWGFIDGEDPKIDNLIKYILERKPLDAIKWLQKPYVPEAKIIVGATRKSVVTAISKRGRTEEIVKAKNGDNQMITSGDGQGKRNESIRKRTRLVLTGGTNEKNNDEVGEDVDPLQSRGRKRHWATTEESNGEAKKEGTIPIRRGWNNIAGDSSPTTVRTVDEKILKVLEELVGKINDTVRVVHTLKKDVDWLMSESQKEERTRQLNNNRLGIHGWDDNTHNKAANFQESTVETPSKLAKKAVTDVYDDKDDGEVNRKKEEKGEESEYEILDSGKKVEEDKEGINSDQENNEVGRGEKGEMGNAEVYKPLTEEDKDELVDDEQKFFREENGEEVRICAKVAEEGEYAVEDVKADCEEALGGEGENFEDGKKGMDCDQENNEAGRVEEGEMRNGKVYKPISEEEKDKRFDDGEEGQRRRTCTIVSQRRTGRNLQLSKELSSPYVPGTETKMMVQRVEASHILQKAARETGCTEDGGEVEKIGDSNDNVKLPNQDSKVISMESRREIVYGPVDAIKLQNLHSFMSKKAKEERLFPIGTSFDGAVFFDTLLKPKKWLLDNHIDAALDLYRLRLRNNPGMFSKNIGFMDTHFGRQWPLRHQAFKSDETHLSFPGGSEAYFTGKAPQYAATNKSWGADLDTIYGVLNVRNYHWVAMVISFPKRSITIYDCMNSSHNWKAIKPAADAFAEMIPFLFRNMASDKGIPVTAYNIEYQKEGVPRTRTKSGGDCGVFALKCIECLSMGLEMSEHELCDQNMKNIRAKLASEMYTELTAEGKSECINHTLGGESSRDVVQINEEPELAKINSTTADGLAITDCDKKHRKPRGRRRKSMISSRKALSTRPTRLTMKN